jgi:hypothetical protein
MTTCIHCNRIFYFKDLYDKHELPCRYINKSRREKRYESELIEVLPNPQEMYKLIQEMMYKIQHLEEDVLRLKNNSNTHARKNVANILSTGPTQNKLFSAWIQDFIVNNTHLEKVFNFDLTEAMISCLKDRIKDEGGSIPLRTLKEQPNVLYVYTDDFEIDENGDKIQLEPSWKKCTPEHIHSMMNWLSNEFLKAFCKWEDENDILIHSTVTEQDKHAMKLVKLVGKINKDKQCSDLKIWLLKNTIG